MATQSKVDVILPAGGRIKGEFAAEAGVEVKALIEFGGRTVLEHMIDTLRASERINRLVVIGPAEVIEHSACRHVDGALPEGDSGPANMLRGIEWLSQQDGAHAERVMIAATDLPFLTRDTVSHFLDACPRDADVCVPVISREEFLARFPGSRDDYAVLRDGAWTIGCAFLVNPVAILQNRDHLERVFDARKSKLGMVRLLGLPFIFSFLTRRLTVSQVVGQCERILGCKGAAVPGCPPELAFDIDLHEEYRYAAARLTNA